MFEAHCLSLGRLCVAWAVVDRQLNDLIAAFTKASPASIACITSSIDAVGTRCEMLRKLGFEDPISEEWASEFERTMWHLSQTIAPKRNRYVHDYWFLSEGTLKRLERRARAKKAQSRKPNELSFDTESIMPVDAVDQLTSEVGQMVFLLHAALRDIRTWRQSRRRTEPPLLCRAYNLPSLPDALQSML